MANKMITENSVRKFLYCFIKQETKLDKIAQFVKTKIKLHSETVEDHLWMCFPCNH